MSLPSSELPTPIAMRIEPRVLASQAWPGLASTIVTGLFSCCPQLLLPQPYAPPVAYAGKGFHLGQLPPTSSTPSERPLFLASVCPLPFRLPGWPLNPGLVDVSAPPTSQHNQGDFVSISSQPKGACAPQGCTFMLHFLPQLPPPVPCQPSHERQDEALPHLGTRHLSDSHIAFGPVPGPTC